MHHGAGTGVLLCQTAFDEREPGADRQRPEDEGAADAEQQHATLILGGDVKLREDDDEDEDVVKRQRLLERVGREIFRRATISPRDPNMWCSAPRWMMALRQQVRGQRQPSSGATYLRTLASTWAL